MNDIKSNKKISNFLDTKFNLENVTDKPYRKQKNMN